MRGGFFSALVVGKVVNDLELVFVVDFYSSGWGVLLIF